MYIIKKMSNNQESIINREYLAPTRPYSQDELKENRENICRKLYLGNNLIKHTRCGHSYLVKKGGKKDKEFIETKNPDCGNCSVCWKIKNIKNKRQRNTAEDMADLYCKMWENHVEDETPSWHEKNDIFEVFYTWLCMENTPHKNKNKPKFNRDRNNLVTNDTYDESIEVDDME
jgi:hypothetical protein